MIRFITSVFFLLVSCVLLSLPSSGLAANKPTIRWVSNDLSPLYINSGPFEGQGIADQISLFLQTYLPDYTHEFENINFSRLYALVERNHLVCSGLLFRNQLRDEILHFSNPYKPAYSQVIVSHHPMDYPPEGLSLEKFIAQHEHVLSVQKRRSYGAHLDPILKKEIQKGHINVLDVSTEQMFKMLSHGRIQHFLDIENSVTYYQATHKDQKNIHIVPVATPMDRFFGRVACTKSPAGQALIQKINQIIEDHKRTDEFRRLTELWIAPENLARFRRIYEKEILK
ncbi:TIGR02285 family protein [Terasakiella pusilla]|uniref:TIGR02285 family protein n=1 Tax=Terasakiella pusilla TaxID=64973 RepID=UPI003AA87790